MSGDAVAWGRNDPAELVTQTVTDGWYVRTGQDERDHERFEVGDNALERTRKVAPVPLPQRVDHIVPAAD